MRTNIGFDEEGGERDGTSSALSAHLVPKTQARWLLLDLKPVNTALFSGNYITEPSSSTIGT